MEPADHRQAIAGAAPRGAAITGAGLIINPAIAAAGRGAGCLEPGRGARRLRESPADRIPLSGIP